MHKNQTSVGSGRDSARFEKPSLDAVLKYADESAARLLKFEAFSVPMEHKEEIRAEAMIRIIEAYARLEARPGWKSFIYRHVRGAILDYLKRGDGFQETMCEFGSSLPAQKTWTMSQRVNNSDCDGRWIDLDNILAYHDVFSDPIPFEQVDIKWELVARMASVDLGLHVFALYIRGATLKNISEKFGRSQSGILKIIRRFASRFDGTGKIADYWSLQTAYALGLCSRLGIENIDQSYVYGIKIGWNFTKVDLDDLSPARIRAAEPEVFATAGGF